MPGSTPRAQLPNSAVCDPTQLSTPSQSLCSPVAGLRPFGRNSHRPRPPIPTNWVGNGLSDPRDHDRVRLRAEECVSAPGGSFPVTLRHSVHRSPLAGQYESPTVPTNGRRGSKDVPVIRVFITASTLAAESQRPSLFARPSPSHRPDTACSHHAKGCSPAEAPTRPPVPLYEPRSRGH